MHVRRSRHFPGENSARKKFKIFLGLFLVLGIIIFFRWLDKKGEPVPIPEEQSNVAVQALAEEKEKVVNYKVAEGDIPADVFSAQGGWDANDTAALLLSAKDVFDFSHIKIGQNLRFYFDQETRAKRLEYDRNTEAVIIAERAGMEFSVREEKINYDTVPTVAAVTIQDFLYKDALAAGLNEATVLEIADIFSFNIDFTTEIQAGDNFVAVYEKRTRDGQVAPDGKILGAKFVNAGKAHYAYYFENDGQGGYYDDEGHVLERQFLKAPLSFRYISSGYTGARYHPITKTVSAHYQIDYAAASGTPVVATARGTVVSARYETGWGNIVRLRHDNGYTTHYGHLSAFAKSARAGASVGQGQVIGYVGSTGWSTGPHLDYGMKLNGSPINPLKLEQPKGAPLSADKMTAFAEMKKQYVEILQ
jgi:murein DD-endopeptidase MepM/ murein hydrolase activator NlpD